MLRVEVRVKTRLAEDWAPWFEGLALTHTDDDQTILSGELVDQAAAYGLMAKLRDLGLLLEYVSLVDVESERAGRSAQSA